MKKVFILLAIVVSFSSCRKWLEITPEGEVLESEAVKSQEDLKNILNSSYDAMANHYNGRVQFFNELLGDNLERPQSGFTVAIYQRTTNFFNSDVGGLYNDLYNVIFRLNFLLFKLNEGAITVDADFKAKAIAEAKFLRAMAHYDLVRLWAQPYGYTPGNTHPGIVIRNEVDTKAKARSSVSSVYEFIIEDLNAAIAGLPDDNGNYANKDAAKALLANVRFQQNDFPNTLALCNELLAKYTLDTTLNRFENVLSSPEKIFAFVSTGVADNRAATYVNNFRIVNPSNPSPNRLSRSLYLEATADTTDRRSKFYAIFNAGTSSETYGITKFNGDFFSNPVLYASQLKLMRAEALVKSSGDLGMAIADVNAIIQRAYGNADKNLPNNTSATDVLTMIRKQRRLEFPLEGNRTQDLKRIGALEDPAGSGLVTIRNSKWNCNGLALQFPVNENTSIFEFNPEGGCE
jgi:starch-binding outer membrane protein, SusD/RagB family